MKSLEDVLKKFEDVTLGSEIVMSIFHNSLKFYKLVDQIINWKLWSENDQHFNQ